MALLTQAPPAAQQYTPSLTPSSDPEDLSGRLHRQLIGVLGGALPLMLWLIAALRPNDPAARWSPQDSVSAYYYTGAVAAFVGLLVALALFLLTYQGYRGKYHVYDRVAAIIAGLAALGVAFFPTKAPTGALKPAWWTDPIGYAHFAFAGILFGMFAVFSLWLFRKTTPGREPSPDKKVRNWIYLVCGLVIVASMAWTVVSRLKGGPIFAPESFALGAFAVSWLVKGEVHTMIAEKLGKKAH